MKTSALAVTTLSLALLSSLSAHAQTTRPYPGNRPIVGRPPAILPPSPAANAIRNRVITNRTTTKSATSIYPTVPGYAGFPTGGFSLGFGNSVITSGYGPGFYYGGYPAYGYPYPAYPYPAPYPYPAFGYPAYPYPYYDNGAGTTVQIGPLPPGTSSITNVGSSPILPYPYGGYYGIYGNTNGGINSSYSNNSSSISGGIYNGRPSVSINAGQSSGSSSTTVSTIPAG